MTSSRVQGLHKLRIALQYRSPYPNRYNVAIELAVAVEVLEAKSVLLDDRHTAGAEVRLRRMRDGETGNEREPTQRLHLTAPR
jgi:hypothetical protein